MCDFLLTFSLLLSLTGLSLALWALAGANFHAARAKHEPQYAATGAEVYGQTLVETYLGYRQ